MLLHFGLQSALEYLSYRSVKKCDSANSVNSDNPILNESRLLFGDMSGKQSFPTDVALGVTLSSKPEAECVVLELTSVSGAEF